MQIQGDYTFDGPRQAVWDLLQDPDVLQAAMPGAKKMEKTGEDEYKATIQVKIGPVGGVFDTRIALTDKTPPEQYTMNVKSQGPTGFANGAAVVKLEATDPATTTMRYDATLQVGGRLASVGQRMLDTVSKSLVRQSLEAMNGALQARLTADAASAAAPPADAPEPSEAADAPPGVPSATTPPVAPVTPLEAKPPAAPATPPEAIPQAASPQTPAYTPPTQAEFAANVAKDVAADAFKSPRFIIGLVVVIVILLLIFVL